MQLRLIFKLVVLLTVANGAPMVGNIFGRNLNRPLDWGFAFIDGRLIFGHSKTIRCCRSWRPPPPRPYSGSHGHTGLVIGTAAMTGDLVSSFLKRAITLATE
jgi:CDP-diglyceride synthetase